MPMTNQNHDTKEILVGLAIGSVIGAAALYFINARRNRPTPVLQKIGKTIADVGEMLEHCHLDKLNDAIHDTQKKVPSGTDIFNNIIDWASTGMNLWKKFNKGR